MENLSQPKFLIIGREDNENVKDLKWEIRRRGCRVACAQMKNLTMKIDKSDGFFEFVDTKNILKVADIFIFRMYKDSILEAKMLAKWLLSHDKVVIDKFLFSKVASTKQFDANLLVINKIPQIKTVYSLNERGWADALSSLRSPIIVKPDNGSKGQGIIKFESCGEALDFLKKNVNGFIAQEYISIKSDIRIFVVGGSVLGGIERRVVENDFRSNVSLGADVIPVEVTKEMRKISLMAVSALKLDIAGVDLIKHENRWHVLEVNAAPQWQGFKKATGINPAEQIVNLAMKRYKKKNKKFFGLF